VRDHHYTLSALPVSMPPNPAASREWERACALAARPAPVPAPEWTSRDGWPAGVTCPSGALTLARRARRAGWSVQITYARGTWTSGRLCESVAVRCAHPVTGLCAVAIYRRTAGDDEVGAGSWGVDRVVVRPAGDVMHSVPKLELAKTLLDGDGGVPDGWMDAVRASRDARDVARKKTAERAKLARATKGAPSRHDGGLL
jgi:hypothetical protein